MMLRNVFAALSFALLMARSFSSHNPTAADTDTPRVHDRDSSLVNRRASDSNEPLNGLEACYHLFSRASAAEDCTELLGGLASPWANAASRSILHHTAKGHQTTPEKLPTALKHESYAAHVLPGLTPQLPELQLLPENVYARAQQLFGHGYRQAAVRDLCTAEHVRVASHDPNDIGSIFDAATVMQVCGFVILRGLFDRHFVQSLATANNQHFWTFYNSSIAPHPELANAGSYETDEFAIRSRGRFEYKLPLQQPFISPKMVGNPSLRAILATAMHSSEVQLDTFSCVVSLPDTPVQHWHADAGSLFTSPLDTPASDLLRAQRLQAAHRAGHSERPEWNPASANTHPRWGYFDAATHLPPHGVVLFVPLINVSRRMGPTEMRPGTHLQCPGDHMVDRAFDSIRLPTCPEHSLGTIHATADVGDAILFDFRISHRGGQNRHQRSERPQIYMTFLKEWYYDAVNFHSIHSREFDGLPPFLRKLNTRLDTRKFAKRLHDLKDSLQ